MASGNKLVLETNAVPHPGEMVLDYLEFHGWSQQDLARRTGLTPKTISEICNGKAPVTPTTALLFEKVFQRPASLWLSLQRRFDESQERTRELANYAEWSEWVQQFPLREMKEKNFSLPAGRSDTDTLLSFFGVSSPRSWDSVWRAAGVAYRQTRSQSIREQAIAAWVREAEIVAAGLNLADFNEQLLLDSLGKLKELSRLGADRIMDPIQQICAEAGVAVVLIPELESTAICGCAKWMTDKKALVGLTLRFKTDDQLWFTFFHEIGHLLLHRNRHSFVVDNAVEDVSDKIVDPEMQRYEREANQFSADALISPTVLGEFIRRGKFTNESIHEFAELVGVGPGIVVGRLQHDGVLQHHEGNRLKQKLGARRADEE